MPDTNDAATATPVELLVRPLFVPLKAAYYEAFVNGTKTTEYRKFGARWNEYTCKLRRRVTISKGYGKQHRRTGVIVGFECKWMATQDWLDCYGEPGWAACIEIDLDDVV